MVDDEETSTTEKVLSKSGKKGKAKVPVFELKEVLSEVVIDDLDSFANEYPKYPESIVAVYHIFRDLHIKQEVTDISIVDGEKWGRSEYFLEANVKATEKGRLLIPLHLDADVDLPWLMAVAKACEAKNGELFLCIYTSETIIYNLITTELP